MKSENTDRLLNKLYDTLLEENHRSTTANHLMKTHLKSALKSLLQKQLFTFPRFGRKHHVAEAMQQPHTNDLVSGDR